MQLLLNIKDNSKAALLMEFLKSLNYVSSIKEVDTEIPEAHKKLVRERIKKSKESALLDWDSVKNDFDGI
jgi:hypothetical protein